MLVSSVYVSGLFEKLEIGKNQASATFVYLHAPGFPAFPRFLPIFDHFSPLDYF